MCNVHILLHTKYLPVFEVVFEQIGRLIFLRLMWDKSAILSKLTTTKIEIQSHEGARL